MVIFVDFGNSEWINSKGIYPLQAEFTELKVQSIAVTLSNVNLFFSFFYYLYTYLLNRSFQRKIQKLVQIIGKQISANNVLENYVVC
jgi:hypothetical protein